MADPRDALSGLRHLPPGVSAVVAIGVDSAGKPRALLLNTDGTLAVSGGTGGGGGGDGAILDGVNAALKATVTAGLALKVDGSAVTQPISAVALPLPAGAAQEHTTAISPHAVRLTDGAAFYDARLVTVQNASIPVTIAAAIDVSDRSARLVGKVRQTDGTLDLTLLNAAPGSDTGQVAVPVRIISSLAAAGGGGTQYAEDTASAGGEQVTMAGVVRNDTRGTLVDTNLDRTELQVNSSGDLRVDGSAVTQPISAASLPLPTGAALDATLTNRTQKTQITDGTRDGTVKAASTLAVATDTAVVVAVRDSVAITAASLPTHGVTQATSPWVVAGDVATGTADSGNPVKIGGVYTVSPTARSTGQRTELATDSKGAIKMVIQALGTDTAVDIDTVGADSALTSKNSLHVFSHLHGYNETSTGWDRVRIAPVPTGGFGVRAVSVAVNQHRKATYQAKGIALASGALVANTAKAILSLHHLAASTKTVRVQKIIVTGVVSTAGAAVVGRLAVQITRGVLAASAGGAVTATLANAAQSAADTTVTSLPTITAATVVADYAWAYSPAAGFTIGTLLPRTVVYEYDPDKGIEPLTIRSATLESLVVNLIATSTPTVTLDVEVEFTEE